MAGSKKRKGCCVALTASGAKRTILESSVTDTKAVVFNNTSQLFPIPGSA
jgi:hypothetical protein